MSQLVLGAALFVGLASIVYAAYELGRLTDYFSEVYGNDRDPHT